MALRLRVRRRITRLNRLVRAGRWSSRRSTWATSRWTTSGGTSAVSLERERRLWIETAFGSSVRTGCTERGDGTAGRLARTRLEELMLALERGEPRKSLAGHPVVMRVLLDSDALVADGIRRSQSRTGTAEGVEYDAVAQWQNRSHQGPEETLRLEARVRRELPLGGPSRRGADHVAEGPAALRPAEPPQCPTSAGCPGFCPQGACGTAATAPTWTWASRSRPRTRRERLSVGLHRASWSPAAQARRAVPGRRARGRRTRDRRARGWWLRTTLAPGTSTGSSSRAQVSKKRLESLLVTVRQGGEPGQAASAAPRRRREGCATRRHGRRAVSPVRASSTRPGRREDR